jgi:putative SOS response-associated peptidase YedK
VPVNSFAEYALEPNPETKKKDVVWFALNEDRPLFAFAGIWTDFKGDRGTPGYEVEAAPRRCRTRSSSRSTRTRYR